MGDLDERREKGERPHKSNTVPTTQNFIWKML